MRNIEKWHEKCYSGIPNQLYHELKQFRADHPYKQISTNGHNWSYIVSKGGSESILMLCGATATGESNWREFPRFSSNYRILAPSYPPVESAEMLIDGVLAIMDAEGIERTHIIGASMGAAIAQWLVRRYPDRVGMLVLMSIGLPDESVGKTMQSMVRNLSRVPAFLLRRQFIREGAKLTSVLP